MSINFAPDFSVLLAVYEKDDPVLLINALKSVFLNTLQPYETLIVADGPLTDNLLSIINDLSLNNKVRLIQLPCNLGLAGALNAGLSEVKTKFTLRADADDINRPNRFELLVEKLREGFDLVGSAVREIDKAGAEVAYRSCPLTESGIRQFARKRNPFNHMTVGFRTAAVIEAGGYPSIYLKEDYALWATLLAEGCRVCNLEEVLVDATAGKEMFRRRGGLRYALAEINLQHHLVKCKLKSAAGAFIDGVLRSAIFLAPNAFREFFYINFLRSQKEDK
jgi:glycosyltransferase involved in cell wall biosynthesis